MGHYIKRTEDDPSGQIEFVDRRDALSSKGTNPEEIFANNFAAELLMPEHLVRSYASGEQPVPLWRLAIKFGVSADAMDVRFKNLSIHR